ncbi:Hypothetical predicted protein [Scomber scombrus]|uniref:Uncharacterized protein n=1 Tax=Scomber scombrus TaxID=13677 RepID=A0AAV1P8S0_SCOSC
MKPYCIQTEMMTKAVGSDEFLEVPTNKTSHKFTEVFISVRSLCLQAKRLHSDCQFDIKDIFNMIKPTVLMTSCFIPQVLLMPRKSCHPRSSNSRHYCCSYDQIPPTSHWSQVTSGEQLFTQMDEGVLPEWCVNMRWRIASEVLQLHPTAQTWPYLEDILKVYSSIESFMTKLGVFPGDKAFISLGSAAHLVPD